MKIVYIDSQNIYMGIKKLGWDIDRQQLIIYLQKKYKYDQCKIFYGYKSDNQPLYDNLVSYGYIMVFKKTSIKEDGTLKGDVDVDICLNIARDYYEGRLSECIVLSGDCDYISIYDFLDEVNTKYHIVVPTVMRVSKLLKDFNLLDLSEQRHFLEKKKASIS